MAQTITFPNAAANKRPAGVVSLMVKVTGDDAYYSLGNPYNAVLKYDQVGDEDTRLRFYSAMQLVEGTIPTMQAGLTNMQGLAALIENPPVAIRAGLSDGEFFQSTNLMSLRWRVSSGEVGKHRLVEYLLRGYMTQAERKAAHVLGASAVAIGTPGADVLANYFDQANDPAQEVPGGITGISFRAKSDDAYVSMGDFRDAKWTWECVGDSESAGRGHYSTSALKFTFDAILLQASKAVLDTFDTVATKEIDLQLTHPDGMVMTLDSPIVGLLMSCDLSGGMDKTRGVPIKAQGVIARTDVATLTDNWLAILG